MARDGLASALKGAVARLAPIHERIGIEAHPDEVYPAAAPEGARLGRIGGDRGLSLLAKLIPCSFTNIELRVQRHTKAGRVDLGRLAVQIGPVPNLLQAAVWIVREALRYRHNADHVRDYARALHLPAQLRRLADELEETP